MATTPPAKAATTSKKIEKASEPKSPLFSAALLAGWLVPGAGHLLSRRWARGGLLFAAIGLMYIGGRLFGVGQTPVQVVTADYGTKFIVVAGLLNVIAAVDAHNIRIGRKS
jgi:hypothetical protein